MGVILRHGPARLSGMALRFEELDFQATPFGEVSLRRRREPTTGVDVHEVLLGDEYLMSSLFTVAEVELARLGLAAVAADAIDVVVGGLGLGYTAAAALEDDRVRTVHVVEALDAVVSWHERGLLPLSRSLTDDPRCTLVTADFFATVGAGDVPVAGAPERWQALLLDIDHSPRHVLAPGNAALYRPDGLRRLAERLHPGGVFALWSDDPPDAPFLVDLQQVFATAVAHDVWFDNPLTGGRSANTVYVTTTH
jgi:spermidine synthase